LFPSDFFIFFQSWPFRLLDILYEILSALYLISFTLLTMRLPGQTLYILIVLSALTLLTFGLTNISAASTFNPAHGVTNILAVSTFNPARPPAIPIGVKSPYFNTWLYAGPDEGNGGYLAGSWAQFWALVAVLLLNT
jgi:hypothetical protein